MDKTYFYTGLGMFALELLSILTFFTIIYIEWTINLFILLTAGSCFVLFNIFAFIFLIKGMISNV